VDLQLNSIEPPYILFHGTATRFISNIERDGLTKQKRHHVHLSENKGVAESVGKRYGTLVILRVNAKEMYEKKYEFYKTNNNVWLVNNVPNEFITKI
jgi:putative RNA 2'-phosphotransferase